MINVNILIKAFDLVVAPYRIDTQRPTKQSIQLINEKLSIQLPSSLIEFALESRSYGNWFAGLGGDYNNPTHILNVNRFTRRIRRRRRRLGSQHGWEYVRPVDFIPITLGFDSDYNCLNKQSFDVVSGEYSIYYWSPPRITSHISSSFVSYLEENIRFWAKGRKGNLEHVITEMLS